MFIGDDGRAYRMRFEAVINPMDANEVRDELEEARHDESSPTDEIEALEQADALTSGPSD